MKPVTSGRTLVPGVSTLAHCTNIVAYLSYTYAHSPSHQCRLSKPSRVGPSGPIRRTTRIRAEPHSSSSSTKICSLLSKYW